MAPFANSIDPRGIGMGAIFLGVTELFIALRHRVSLKCGRCGFDPVIYRRSQEEAARLVREHIARRAANPAHFLSEPVMAAGRKAAIAKSKRGEKSRRERLDSPHQP